MTFQNIDVAQFKDKMENKEVVILDVRTEAEVNEGCIPGHIMINFMSPFFAEQVDKLDKDTTYLVYCRSGGRSSKACEMMSKMGFQSLFNLEGGMMAWNIEN